MRHSGGDADGGARPAGALAPECRSDVVVVAPDLGAVKLAEHYASLLQRPVAVVRKTRVTARPSAPSR